jgi:hypothetical protein
LTLRSPGPVGAIDGVHRAVHFHAALRGAARCARGVLLSTDRAARNDAVAPGRGTDDRRDKVPVLIVQGSPVSYDLAVWEGERPADDQGR